MNWRPLTLRLDRLLGALRGRVSGASIGPGTVISGSAELSVWRGGSITIGGNCTILKGAILSTYPNGRIRLGDHCSVNPYCVIYGHGGVDIGNSVRIAAHAVLVSANHRHADPDVPIRHQGLSCEGIKIGDNVWIGAGARILDGVEILPGCVIGAGAVVTRSTPEVGVYAGVPARLVKPRGAAGDGPTPAAAQENLVCLGAPGDDISDKTAEGLK